MHVAIDYRFQTSDLQWIGEHQTVHLGSAPLLTDMIFIEMFSMKACCILSRCQLLYAGVGVSLI